MNTITITKGVDLPLEGAPRQEIREGNRIAHVALVGDDFIDLKPSMLVREGDRVQLGQPVFTDKKNPGFSFTAPGCGVVQSIHRGAKRKFESLVIELDGEDAVSFSHLTEKQPAGMSPEEIRQALFDSGLWTAFRTRPYGKIPACTATPSSVFVNSMDSQPLGVDPAVVVSGHEEEFRLGLEVLVAMLGVPVHICSSEKTSAAVTETELISCWQFSGPHPAGLPSTHIHYIDPVHEGKEVWLLDYHDVISLGHLFLKGEIRTEIIVALGGENFSNPSLVRTFQGACLQELCMDELVDKQGQRLLSGSVLDGRPDSVYTGYLGRYHRQVSVVKEGSGRSLFGWMAPGTKRFSVTRLFASAFSRQAKMLPFITAVWGGDRAIYPLDVYDRVMPLDIMALPLLKSLAIRDTEKSAALGCLELVEEDLALCSFVCPGKNEFGPMLREVLRSIERGE
ncbi:Na(+)-translocating NADH-quinone reductase subunit A [Desulfogranum japonicum]|uniref:Na(+)-translocating NADH-quinone reductase subunit A n=1 Tax=Desulfogranum japonicum TaxID=231447 RepID=UPI0004169368|nr:Na(+)-translocating NADH-quinone reductase subunit A [Desulfogranum japonicum]